MNHSPERGEKNSSSLFRARSTAQPRGRKERHKHSPPPTGIEGAVDFFLGGWRESRPVVQAASSAALPPPVSHVTARVAASAHKGG